MLLVQTPPGRAFLRNIEWSRRVTACEAAAEAILVALEMGRSEAEAASAGVDRLKGPESPSLQMHRSDASWDAMRDGLIVPIENITAERNRHVSRSYKHMLLKALIMRQTGVPF